MTDLPGDPRSVWAAESGRSPNAAERGRWRPTVADLPAWQTSEDLDRNYSAVPQWWERWLAAMIAAFIAAIALPSLYGKTGTDTPMAWMALVLWLLVIVVLVVAVLLSVAFEVRLRTTRGEWVSERLNALQRTAIPVWAVLATRVRVSDGGDSVYDLQFAFDLRVPEATLELQYRVIDTWLRRIERTFETEHPQYLPAGYARATAVHCADVFGEGMRGVWIWAKGSVLPIQVLGLATDDPRTAESFSADSVVFIREQPKPLRTRSTIAPTRTR